MSAWERSPLLGVVVLAGVLGVLFVVREVLTARLAPPPCPECPSDQCAQLAGLR